MFAKVAGFLLLLLVFGAVQINADPVYEVTGTMQVPANSSFPGVVEAINYSFMLSYVQTDIGTVTELLGTPTITSFGPLGTFSEVVSTGFSGDGFIAFVSPSAEIDLLVSGIGPGDPGPPVVNGADIYSCSTQLACTEFYPDQIGGSRGYELLVSKRTFRTRLGKRFSVCCVGSRTRNALPLCTWCLSLVPHEKDSYALVSCNIGS